jgi:hypothetical protein
MIVAHISCNVGWGVSEERKKIYIYNIRCSPIIIIIYQIDPKKKNSW